MNFWRASWFVLVAASLAVPFKAALAQDFPNRPIRLVVPYTPGGGVDRTARLLAQHLPALLGQPVVVENRGGASGDIGTDMVAKAAPDGYTWVMGSDPPFTINQHLRKTPFDPMKDFAPVILITKVPTVLIANPSLPADDVAGLVKLAKEKPGHLTAASSGSGSVPHLAAGLLMTATDTKLLHIPYKGQAEAIADVIGGRADLIFSALENVSGLIKSGKLKAVAIGSDKRLPGLPAVKTIAESGYPVFDVSGWHGVLVPAATPRALVLKINEAVNKMMQMPDVASRLDQWGLVSVGGAPEVLTELIKADSERWGKVIRSGVIKAE